MEDRLWDQWKVDYARMDKETFVSFEDYKAKAFKEKVENKIDIKEILEKAEKIKNMDQRKEVINADI